MRNLVTGALASGVLLVGVVGQAQAATTIGQSTGRGSIICGSNFTWVQAATAATTPSYAVPPAGGVITS